jgi:small subunit ribosomal protein S19
MKDKENIGKMDQQKRRVPFVDKSLIDKIRSTKGEVKTMSRSCTILPMMVGRIIGVYNGKTYIPVTIVDEMVGHKLGEYSLTRVFPDHEKDKDKAKAKPKGGKK